jgi:hypothetical protein
VPSVADLDGLIGRVPAQVVTQLRGIDCGRGSEALYRDQMPGVADRARRPGSCPEHHGVISYSRCCRRGRQPSRADYQPANVDAAQPKRTGTGRLSRCPGLPVPSGLAAAECRPDSSPAPTALRSHGHARGSITIQVLLSGLFVLDLLVIYPFADGNGRVARLLTSAMLSEHGYTVGLYVSLGQPSPNRLTPTPSRSWTPPVAGTKAPPTHGPGSATSPK